MFDFTKPQYSYAKALLAKKSSLDSNHSQLNNNHYSIINWYYCFNIGAAGASDNIERTRVLSLLQNMLGGNLSQSQDINSRIPKDWRPLVSVYGPARGEVGLSYSWVLSEPKPRLNLEHGGYE